MTTFFTGCTHFDHENIIRLASRPFATVDEMNEAIVDRWNAKVGARDVVWHLGDFGWIKDQKRAETLLKRLNGTKSLILGNHDPRPVSNARGWLGVETYAKLSDGAVLFHYPIEEWHGFFKGHPHLHAHTHQHSKRGKIEIPNRINVTVEAWDYAPAAIEELAAVWAGSRP